MSFREPKILGRALTHLLLAGAVRREEFRGPIALHFEFGGQSCVEAASGRPSLNAKRMTQIEGSEQAGGARDLPLPNHVPSAPRLSAFGKRDSAIHKLLLPLRTAVIAHPPSTQQLRPRQFSSLAALNLPKLRAVQPWSPPWGPMTPCFLTTNTDLDRALPPALPARSVRDRHRWIAAAPTTERAPVALRAEMADTAVGAAAAA
jgi:hypothetical protein